jgi:hypothetical protein
MRLGCAEVELVLAVVLSSFGVAQQPFDDRCDLA